MNALPDQPAKLTEAAARKALESGGYVDLSDHAKFRLSGEDRVRYLSGQVTQAVSDASEMHTLYSCITNHKGKLDGDLYISGSDNLQAFLLDTVPEQKDSLFARLDRYIIADDATLEDITEQWRLIHVIGSEPVAPPLHGRTANRFGIEGRDFWIGKDSDASPITEHAPQLTDAAVEWIRVTHRIPKWGSELGPDVLPPEARLEDRAISYTKGCYIGQEVISRIRSVGRVNRTLEYIEWVSGSPLRTGMVLTDSGSKEVGKITSVVWHPLHPDGPRSVAMAFVKRGASEPGSRLSAAVDAGSGTEPVAENMLSSVVEVRNTPELQEI